MKDSAGSASAICEIAHGSTEYRETVNLREAVLRKPLGLRFSTGELEAERESIHLACYRDGRLVGCLVLRPCGDGDIQMRQVAVLTSVQRRGVGTSLVRHSESLALTRGYRRMTLHAREEAVPFYERLGYRTAGDRFEEVTIPHWAMEKSLMGADLCGGLGPEGRGTDRAEGQGQ